jgi:hypothetical protein
MSIENIATKENPRISIVKYREGARRTCNWKENGKPVIKLYSRWIWEKQFGEIPHGYHVYHKDHNLLNDFIENYELIRSGSHSKCTELRDWIKFLKQHDKFDNNFKETRFWDSLDGINDAQKLNNVLKKYKKSQREMSILLNISESIISRMVRGNRNAGYHFLRKMYEFIQHPKELINYCRSCSKKFNRIGFRQFCNNCRDRRNRNQLFFSFISK